MKKILVSLMAIVMLLSMAACSKKCDECGEKLGNIYCKDCVAEELIMKCEECGKEVKNNYIVTDGEAYCEDCIAECCAYCNSEIDGDGFKHDGKTYCNELCALADELT